MCQLELIFCSASNADHCLRVEWNSIGRRVVVWIMDNLKLNIDTTDLVCSRGQSNEKLDAERIEVNVEHECYVTLICPTPITLMHQQHTIV